MATPAQIEANRRNSLKSTGPRSAEWKAAASRNAVTHGLWAADAVIPGEDPQLFAEFARQMLAELSPHGAQQRCVADRLVHLYWKLRRLPRLETATVRELLALHGDAGEAAPDATTAEQVSAAMAKDVTGRVSVLLRLQMHEMRLESAIRANLKRLDELRGQDGKRDEDAFWAGPAAQNTVAEQPARTVPPVPAPAKPAARNEANSAPHAKAVAGWERSAAPNPALVRAVNAVPLQPRGSAPRSPDRCPAAIR